MKGTVGKRVLPKPIYTRYDHVALETNSVVPFFGHVCDSLSRRPLRNLDAMADTCSNHLCRKLLRADPNNFYASLTTNFLLESQTNDRNVLLEFESTAWREFLDREIYERERVRIAVARRERERQEREEQERQARRVAERTEPTDEQRLLEVANIRLGYKKCLVDDWIFDCGASDEPCVICMDEVGNKIPGHRSRDPACLVCLHKFHYECIKGHIEQSLNFSECPVCRTRIDTDESVVLLRTAPA